MGIPYLLAEMDVATFSVMLSWGYIPDKADVSINYSHVIGQARDKGSGAVHTATLDYL